VAGERQEFIEAGRKAPHQLRCPRQPGQRDVRRRQRGAQREQGRHRAQHVARMQGPEHHDGLDVETLQQGTPGHGIVRK